MPTPDFTQFYNTPLGEQKEAEYQQWAVANGKDPVAETYDYDLRGYFALTDGASLSGGHLTDQFKKPNHPTFSEESMYHGADGYDGGHWDDNKTFTPGTTNMLSNTELSQYFGKFEDEYTVSPNPMTNPL